MERAGPRAVGPGNYVPTGPLQEGWHQGRLGARGCVWRRPVVEAHQGVQKEGLGLSGDMANRLRLGTGATGSGDGISKPFRGSDSQGNPDSPARH